LKGLMMAVTNFISLSPNSLVPISLEEFGRRHRRA
jgi:hypothetical protein